MCSEGYLDAIQVAMEGQNWQEASIFIASHDSSKNLPPGLGFRVLGLGSRFRV
jgi:hypothetical protein